MLIESGLPIFFWSFAVLHAADVMNMCLPHKPDSRTTCYEKMLGKPPDVTQLRPFGCKGYVLLESIQRDNKHFSERRENRDVQNIATVFVLFRLFVKISQGQKCRDSGVLEITIDNTGSGRYGEKSHAYRLPVFFVVYFCRSKNG